MLSTLALGFVRYYASLLWESHRVTREHLGRLAPWLAYGAVAATKIPVVAAAIASLPPVVVSWGRPTLVVGIFVSTLMWQNYRRVFALHVEHRLHLLIREIGWFHDDWLEVRLDVANLGVQPMGMRSEWVLALQAADGSVDGVFDGSAEAPVTLLQPNALQPVVVRFPVGRAKWRQLQPTVATVSAFDTHEKQLMSYVHLRPLDGAVVYP